MTERLQRQLLRQLSIKSLVLRILCLGLFAWVTIFNPLHLLQEHHSDDPLHEGGSAHEVALSADQSDSGHGSHKTHSASDHKIRATSQTPASVENCPVLLAPVPAAEPPPSFSMPLFLVERVNPPGMNLPGPLLPRAPPAS